MENMRVDASPETVRDGVGLAGDGVFRVGNP